MTKLLNKLTYTSYTRDRPNCFKRMGKTKPMEKNNKRRARSNRAYERGQQAQDLACLIFMTLSHHFSLQ